MENHMLNDPEEEGNDNKVPPGFRFNPYDVELLEHYLLKLVYGEKSPEVLGIPAVDLYYYPPQELTAMYKEQCENQWYFFTQRNRKYGQGTRPDRAAGVGFWKQTNVVKPIFKVQEDKTNLQLGRKITLDYYDKSKKTDGERTSWKMIEYRVNEKLPYLPSNYSSAGTSTELDEWCLCRIYISARTVKKPNNVGATSEEKNEQVTGNAQVTRQAESELTSGTNFIQQNIEHSIAAQELSEQVPVEADANFLRQDSAPLFSNQHAIAPQGYYGQNAGGPDTNSFQQTTTPFINHDFLNTSNSYYLENATDGPMNEMDYNKYNAFLRHEEIYPMTGQYHDNGLPATGLPMLPHSDFNQSSASIPEDVTRSSEDGSLFSLVFGNGHSSSSGYFRNGGSDQSGNSSI
ncbi:hypothetical protein POM88_018089 [Heracleum sosnowskyi]|uniref:NAC domain-containing protein n=1 Tax=Heracleum sosnowskyi TaxID=360622 RepID=A0AAD8MYT6_9APIA|nr:hypothetical protein POM88_018089 [Heracleum sosnowskyi]